MALVLSRKVGETIKIGNDIEVVVTKVGGNRVHLAVKAERGTRIWRSEIEEKKDAEERT